MKLRKVLAVSLTMILTAVIAQGASITSDDFSGASIGDQWEIVGAGDPGNYVIQEDSVLKTYVSNQTNYRYPMLRTKEGYATVSGDFSIEIQGTNYSASGYNQSAYIMFYIGDTRYGIAHKFHESGGSFSPVQYRVDSTYTTGIANLVMGSSNPNEYKVERVGTTLSFYAKALSDADWTTLGSTTVSTEAADLVYFGVGNSSANSFGMSWDNFVVTPAVPEPATMGLLGMGVVAILAKRRKK